MKFIKYQVGGNLSVTVFGHYYSGKQLPASFFLLAPALNEFVFPRIEIAPKEAAKIIRAMQQEPEYTRVEIR